MFIETKEGQTHATCEDQLKKYGGKAKCCLCNVHEGCSIANSKGMFSPHEMTKAIKHAGKYMKKEQDKVLRNAGLENMKREGAHCKCHCHTNHEGFSPTNPKAKAYCKCMPNCEHCNPYYVRPPTPVITAQ